MRIYEKYMKNADVVYVAYAFPEPGCLGGLHWQQGALAREVSAIARALALEELSHMRVCVPQLECGAKKHTPLGKSLCINVLCMGRRPL